MTAHVRKAIGSVLILAFLVLYIAVAAGVGRHVPKVGLLEFLYYFVAGTAWGVPLIPLISWMNRGR
jgi:hypothetical protein